MRNVAEIEDEISVKMATIDTCVVAIGNGTDVDFDKVALVLNQTETDLEKLIDELGKIARKAPGQEAKTE